VPAERVRQTTDTLKEFFAGCVAGFSKVFTGQPFDIVKVRLQAAPKESKPSPITIVNNIIKNEGGPLALWKGSLPPLLGVGATASIQFGVNENVKKAILKYNNGRKLSFEQLFLSGWLGGFANCIVSTPAEHFRIRIQTQSKENPVYKGSIDCMKKIFKTYGIRGVYKGVVPTIFRDSFGYAVYFSVYTTLMNKMAPGQSRREYNIGKIGFAGAIAGILFWASVFPFDVIKTRIQTDSLTSPQYRGIVDAFRKTYQANGLKGFSQGFVPCMLRAVPVNGAVFMLYELLYRNIIAPAPKLAALV
jgi:solute carrier family 25 carnitine/acylcarnitine transporter 20/29